MSYDKMLYEAQKHWRKRQKIQRQKELIEAERLANKEHEDEIKIVKRAAFIAVFIERADIRHITMEVSDVLSKVDTIAELNFYYKWCCGRLD